MDQNWNISSPQPQHSVCVCEFDRHGKGMKSTLLCDRNTLRIAQLNPFWWPLRLRFSLSLSSFFFSNCASPFAPDRWAVVVIIFAADDRIWWVFPFFNFFALVSQYVCHPVPSLIDDYLREFNLWMSVKMSVCLYGIFPDNKKCQTWLPVD